MGYWIAAGAFIALIAVILIRTILFRPEKTQKQDIFNEEDINENIAEHLGEMVRCRTISNKDISLEDVSEFERFRKLLKDIYPNIHSLCEPDNIGRNGLLYHWKGKNSNSPLVLMAHYDVVPADDSQWEKDPFAGTIENGVLWGRGTLDTKGTLCSILEACEKLISDGYAPEKDIYLSFSGEEEINGDSTPCIVEFLKNRGIKPCMVLDEGGAIVQGAVPGVRDKCALIGTGEKGKMHLRLSVKGKGGHGSAPPAISPVGRLARSVVRIERKPFRQHLSSPAKEMFETVGRHSSFGLRMVFANLWLFSPILGYFSAKMGGEINALFRTTVAFTKMKGSEAINVFSPVSSVDADVRIMEGDTGESILKDIRSRVKDDKVEVESLELIPVRPFSGTNTKEWEKLKETIHQVWGRVVVSPYLMIACSDSRHYTDICDNVYRFSAMELSSDERKMIHGNNERIPVDKLMKTVRFYLKLIRKF